LALLGKCILRLSEDIAPRSKEYHDQQLEALRWLDAQLLSRRAKLSDCESSDFEAAETAASKGASPNTVNAIRQGLANVACVIKTCRLSKRVIDYHPVFHDAAKNPDPDDIAQIRLPTEAAIAGLKALSAAAPSMTEAIKVILWVVILLFVAPWRISEILNLAADCERFADRDGRPCTEADWLRDPHGIRYGLSYLDIKSGRDSVKWIKTEAVPVVRDVIARIRAITEPARQIAAYIGRTGRPRLPEHMTSRMHLSIADIQEILQTDNSYAYRWLRDNGIKIEPSHVRVDDLLHGLAVKPAHKESEKRRIKRVHDLLRSMGDANQVEIETLRPVLDVRFPFRWLRERVVTYTPDTVQCEDVERALMRRHHGAPDDFPLRTHEMLFVFPSRYFDSRCSDCIAVTCLMTVDHVRLFLTGDANRSSIFELLNLEEPDGSPIHLTPTMFRRHIVTLARRSGLNATQTVRWLGHANERSLPAYDRRTAAERRAGQREFMGTRMKALGIR
jgi:hypothetical protein